MEATEVLNAIGQRVRVVRPISQTERELLGREFTLIRLAKPHGYAVVGDLWGSWWVHPEALEEFDGCQHESVTTPDGHGAYCRFCGETLA